jgi:DNA polymerase III subunit delta'
MGFKDFPDQGQGVQLLQRSLERGRLAHGYLFTGHALEELERLAQTLARTLNCQQPVVAGGKPIDCCDRCVVCRKIEHGNHTDVHWVRPESKSRVITVEQMRELMREIQLKPNEGQYKVAVIVAADRLGIQAANAFLKTLEEPPANSVLILLTTEPHRILETILSRCLRLNFTGTDSVALPVEQMAWLKSFTDMAANEQKSLLSRYRLMDFLIRKLNEIKGGIEEALTARSPLQQYKDAEKDQIERWEDELAAAIEAEYRRQRTDLIGVLQWWLRDVWLETLASPKPPQVAGEGRGPVCTGATTAATELLKFPQLQGTRTIAARISPADARTNLEVLEQLHLRLGTNVQEALALEVGLLKLHL